MAARRRRPPLATGRVPAAPSAGRPDPATAVAAGGLALALAGAAWGVDPLAAAAFDAPKRLAALVGTGIALVALLAWPRATVGHGDPCPAGRPGPARLAAGALGAATVGIVASALCSPRPAVALASLRTLVLLATLLPLGASRVLEGRPGRWLLAWYLGSAVVAASSALLQGMGALPLLRVAAAGRAGGGGLAGNEGILAMELAVAVPAAVGGGLLSRTPAARWAAAGATTLAAVGLAAIGSFTGVLAAATGLATLVGVWLAGRPRVRLRPVVAGLLAAGLVAAVAVTPTLRGRLAEARQALGAADWDHLTSYRLGAWAAALEMARARPLVGWGPGTFAAEYVPHRLVAEQRWHTRLVNPFLAGSYTEAHDEYLQAAAEWGIPAAAAAALATAALLAGLARLALSRGHPGRGEAGLLLGMLAAGVVGAVTWFPLERPLTAVPLLLAAGRGWRLLHVRGGPAPAETGSSGVARPALARRAGCRIVHLARSRPVRAVAAAAVVALLWPEGARYAAERRLRAAEETVLHATRGGARAADVSARLAGVEATAVAAVPHLPGDPRPLALAGGAALLARRPQAALTHYRDALAGGERPEIVLNAARALAALGDADGARDAALRAGWVSPAVLAWLPRPAAETLGNELALQAARLRAGGLATLPRLPEALRGAGAGEQSRDPGAAVPGS